MKISKKILSLILCVVMVFAVTVPAFASEEAEKYPTIYVPGIASSNIYAAVNDASVTVDVPDSETLTAMLKNEIIPALIVYAADSDLDKFGHTVTKALNTAFAHWFNNPDGTPVGNAGVINHYPAHISENSTLTFSYDWRGDPMVIASQLNDYINYVTQTSGCDKVALSSHSLGAVVILSYLSVYGNDKVYGWVMDTPAMEGVSYVADLLCGEIEITGEAVLTFLKGTLGENEYEELITSSLDILEMAGMSDLVIGFFDDVIKKLSPVLFEETLLPIFGHWLTIWAMVPEERVEETMKCVFEGYGKEKDLSALKTKIESYNNTVRKNRKETLLTFDEDARVAVISRYGHVCFPITSSWKLAGDAVIETSSSSLGAVTAPVGDYFSDEYLADKNMKYISPDKTVDASSCLFPEKTWFIKDILHEETKYTKPLYAKLLFGEEEATCDNFSMSRFVAFDRESDSFIEDETVPEKAEKLSPLQRLFNFLKALFDKIISFFANKK